MAEIETPELVRVPHVLIIGGGFGGLAAARSLADAGVDITLIDRRNHHLFQPLLYQVATAGLAPGNIALTDPVDSRSTDQPSSPAGRGHRHRS